MKKSICEASWEEYIFVFITNTNENYNVSSSSSWAKQLMSVKGLYEPLVVLVFYDFFITIGGIVNPSSIRRLSVSRAS